MPSKCVCIQIPFNATIDTSDRSRSACISVRTRFVARVEAGALPNKTADNVKQWFWENIVCRYGTPTRHCDRQQWRIQRGIRSAAATLRRHPPPYVTTPSTSQWAREKNEPNSYSLAREVNSARNNWDEKIPLALLGTRASRQATTKLAPAEVLLGHKIRLPVARKYWCGKKPWQTMRVIHRDACRVMHAWHPIYRSFCSSCLWSSTCRSSTQLDRHVCIKG